MLAGSNLVLLHQLIQLLSSKFKLQDLRVVHYFLDIEVHPTTMSIMLQQDKYILDIFHWASMSSCKPVDTLMSTSKVVKVSDCFFLSYTFLTNYWIVVKHILCFLKSTVSFGLHITHSSFFSLHGFTDIDWAGSIGDHKCKSGYLVFFGHTLIS